MNELDNTNKIVMLPFRWSPLDSAPENIRKRLKRKNPPNWWSLCRHHLYHRRAVIISRALVPLLLLASLFGKFSPQGREKRKLCVESESVQANNMRERRIRFHKNIYASSRSVCRSFLLYYLASSCTNL